MKLERRDEALDESCNQSHHLKTNLTAIYLDLHPDTALKWHYVRLSHYGSLLFISRFPLAQYPWCSMSGRPQGGKMCYPKKRLYSPCESWGVGIRGCPLTRHLGGWGLEYYCFLQRGSILRLSVKAIRAGKNSPPSAFKTFLTYFVSVNRGGIELFVIFF